MLLCLPLPSWAATGDIIARLGPGGDPQWSPDGEYISFLDRDGLYITPADGRGSRTKLAEPGGPHFRYIWASDTEIVFSVTRSRSDTTTFGRVRFQHVRDTAGKAVGAAAVSTPDTLISLADDRKTMFEVIQGPVRLADGAVGYYRAFGSPMGPVRFESLPGQRAMSVRERDWPHFFLRREGERFCGGWCDLWLSTVSTKEDTARPLTSGRSLGLLAQSPKGDMVIAMDIGQSGSVIFDTSGREVTSRFEPEGARGPDGLMRGVGFMTWSPDGTRLCYIRTREDGDNVYGARLMLSDLSNTNVIELVGEQHEPVGVRGQAWAPDGIRLAVATRKSGLLIIEAGP